jgi:hypothetical protein
MADPECPSAAADRMNAAADEAAAMEEQSESTIDAIAAALCAADEACKAFVSGDGITAAIVRLRFRLNAVDAALAE